MSDIKIEMGKASHERKSDKETQSPMLKIFREIMQREKAPNKDPENASLLKDRKKKKKKRKFFSHSSSQKHEDDSSANEDPGPRIIQYDGRNKDQMPSIHQAPSTDKQESWLYCATKDRARKKSSKDRSKPSKNKSDEKLDPDDTFSCVSCALKKIASNEYVCIGALGILFLISVIFACCALFNTFPAINEKAGQDKESELGYGLDSDMFKNKIDHLSDHVKETGKIGRRSDRSTGDERLPGNLNLISRLRENDIGDLNLETHEDKIASSPFDLGNVDKPAAIFGIIVTYHQMNAVDRSRVLTDDLSRVLATSKLNEVTDNVQIRDFYKKLLYTDAQIKRLKRLALKKRNNKSFNDRQKRSIFHRIHRFKTVKHHKTENSNTTEGYEKTSVNEYRIAVEKVGGTNKGRQRRNEFGNASREPSGIIFEKKKLLVKFIKDDEIKFPKCSHVNTVHDDHYFPLVHDYHNYPFAQHTQKLDEILDKLLDQKIPDVLRETPTTRTEAVKRIGTQISNINADKFNREETTSEKTTPTTHASARLKDKIIKTTLKPTDNANSPLSFIYETTANVYKSYIKPGMNKAKSKIKAEILKMLNSPVSSTTQMTTMTMTTTTTTSTTPTQTTTTETPENYEFDLTTEPAYRSFPRERESVTSFMPGFDLILSVSTLINPSEKRVTKFISNDILRRFPIRKLMQADEVEEEAIGYEDLKEVLSDDMQTHDETDKNVDKKKRDVNQIIAQSQLLNLIPQTAIPTKPNPLDVHNPNWKGPTPLYQDEINSMIENAVIQNTNKMAVPLNTKDISSELGIAESELNDVQYVEDYLSGKYDKLVKMAQAYSDYGVLTQKKDELRLEKNEIPNAKQDTRVKMLANDSFYDLDDSLSKRSKQSVDGDNSRLNTELRSHRNPLKAIAKYFKPAKDKNLERDLKKTTANSEMEHLPSKSTNKIKKEDYMIFNTRDKRTKNFDVENVNSKFNSSSIVTDEKFLNTYREVPRRSLKSVDLDKISEEVLLTDFNSTTNKSTSDEIKTVVGANKLKNDLVDKDNLAINNTYDDLSDLIVKDEKILNTYREVPRRSLKSVDLDKISEEVLLTDFNSTTNKSTSDQIKTVAGAKKLKNVLVDKDNLAINNTYDDLSDLNVTFVKKNNSAVKLLDYNNGNVFEIYVMPLISNKSDILYDYYQDTYPELTYTDEIMTFPSNKVHFNNNSSNTDTDLIAAVFEINLNKAKVFSNTNSSLDDYNIPEIKINTRENVNSYLKNHSHNAYLSKSFLTLNATFVSQEKSFQNSSIKLPFNKEENFIDEEKLKQDSENKTITSTVHSRNLRRVLEKRNKSLHDYVTSSEPTSGTENRKITSLIDQSINILSLSIKDQNKSLDDYVANSKLTSTTENEIITSTTDPRIILLSIFLKEQNKSLDDYMASPKLTIDTENAIISSAIDPSINLLSIISKEQNKSLDDYVVSPKLTNGTENRTKTFAIDPSINLLSIDFVASSKLTSSTENGTMTSTTDPSINLLSIILRELNTSVCNTKTTKKYQKTKNVLLKDFMPNHTRKKRLSDKNYAFHSYNMTNSKSEKSTNNGTKNKVSEQNRTKFDPSDFFLMASNFFSSLSGIFFDKAIEKDPLLNLVALLTVTNHTNASITNTTRINKTKTNSENIEYSLYDSEMVDNIGHRSRVLLSIEEKSNVVDNETERSEDIIRTKGGGSTEVFTTESELQHAKDNSTDLTTQIYVKNDSFLKMKDKNENTPSYKTKDDKKIKANKSLVKRSAPEDSNLIFWNDIYDEEYGIQTDPLENTIRGKNSLPGNELMKRSGVWLQNKMKRIGESIKKQSKDGLDKIYSSNNKLRKSRDYRGLDSFFKKRDYPKNNDRNFDDELFKETDVSRINSLPHLSDHMKKVCEEAARAVQMRQDMKADTAYADSQKNDEALSVNLMQNLVRLLSDLVDYQVQLKTCNKLPDDLHQFLIWLKTPVMESKDEKAVMNVESRAKMIEAITQTKVSPAASTPQARLNTIQIRLAPKVNSRVSTLPTPSQAWPTEREDSIQPEERAEYIGALHAVQDLLRQYEMMSAEDKTKMAGVKEYLQNQLSYLSRQLYPNEYSYSHLYSQNPNRYRLKRDSSTISKRHAPFHPGRRNYRQRRHNQSNYKLRGRPNKFVKSFGRKHTRTTAVNYDNGAITTETKKQIVKVDKGQGLARRSARLASKDDDKEHKDGKKRSLLNVYYHAVEEAKKSSTIKNDMNVD